MGVNKHRLEHEDRVEVLSIDNTTVREKQIARIKQASLFDALRCRVDACQLLLSPVAINVAPFVLLFSHNNKM